MNKVNTNRVFALAVAVIGSGLWVGGAEAQVAVRGRTVLTMSGPPLENGVVIINGGKITAIGPAATTPIPDGYRVLDATVVTPGLIDAHSVVGLTGIYNQKHDQDQLEHSSPIQPELRAIDAYNAHEELVAWVRSFGVTTLHTGHAPGELISGQTFIVKTTGNTVGAAVVTEAATVAATLSGAALKGRRGAKPKSPGTRGKLVAMLRAELIKAQEYRTKRASAEDDKKPARDLKLEALVRVLDKELPLMVTAQLAQDIANALRVAREFDIRIILDGGAEAYSPAAAPARPPRSRTRSTFRS